MRDTELNTSLYTRTYYTFATLPTASAGNAGQELYITDANASPLTNFGQTAAGSGTFLTRVRSTGAAWKLAGPIP